MLHYYPRVPMWPVLAWLLLGPTLACSDGPGRQQPVPSAPFAQLQARFPAAHLAEGRAVYMRQCVTCHQADGLGTGAAIPPLVGHLPKLLAAAGGRAYLARLGLYGLTGRIEVNGRSYFNLMPAQGMGLRDQDVAGALNYALTQWGHDVGLRPEQLLRADEVAQERLQKRSAADNLTLRQTLELPGEVPPPPQK